MTNCPYCGKKIADDSVSCSECGTRLLPSVPATLTRKPLSRQQRMKALQVAAVIAFAAEGLFCGAFAMYGKLAMWGPGDSNALGIAAALFHTPGLHGLSLLDRLFPHAQPSPGGMYLGAGFLMFTGALQFFLFVWFIILEWMKYRASRQP